MMYNYPVYGHGMMSGMYRYGYGLGFFPLLIGLLTLTGLVLLIVLLTKKIQNENFHNYDYRTERKHEQASLFHKDERRQINNKPR